MLETIKKEFTKTFIKDARWKVFTQGFKNTLIITVVAGAIGIIIGIAISLIHAISKEIRSSKNKTIWGRLLLVLDSINEFYVSVIRGTPLAIQLTIMAFIIMAGVDNKIIVCCVAFGLNSAAYVSEVIRGGIEAVDIGQTEAGRSLGLSAATTLTKIVLPQAFKSILPALCNEFIAVLKETSIVGLISVVDLTRASDLVRSRTLSPYFPLISVAIVYYVLVLILSTGVKNLEKNIKNSYGEI